VAYKGEKVHERGRAKVGDPNEVGMCLREIRRLFGVGPHYSSAASAWRNAKHRHSGNRRGYPCFWTGGSQGYGHIALDLGGGYCLSTDMPHGGHWGIVKKSLISSTWNMTYAGYTTDLNTVSLWVPSVDLSKLRYAASGHPSYYPYGVHAVEHVLDLFGYEASKYVNGYWDRTRTGDAWKRFCQDIGTTVSRTPTEFTAKRLGARGYGHLIINP
jgi:hypothetical protein